MLRTGTKISNSFHIFPITHNTFEWQIMPFLVSPKFIVIFKGMKLPHIMRTVSQGGNQMAQVSWDSLPWPFVWTAVIFHLLSPSSQLAERDQRASCRRACWVSNRPKWSNLSWLLPIVQESWHPWLPNCFWHLFHLPVSAYLNAQGELKHVRKGMTNRLWPRRSYPIRVKFCHLLTFPSSFSFGLDLSLLSLLHFPGLSKRTKVW